MAGSRSLGTLTLDLVARIGGFTQGMNAAERKTDSTARNIQRKLSGIGKVLGTTFGLSIAGAITGIVAGVNSAIDRMDSLRDASIRLGVGVETLSAYSFAAEQLGTDIDSLGKGFKILAKNVADAGEGKGKAPIFEALGISLKDAEGNLRSLEDLIPDIANAFKQLEDGTQKAALAQELFGKSGLDLIEFLDQGADGLKGFTDKARELGLVIDQDAADKADEFNDLLGEMKSTFSGLETEIAIQLLPTMIGLAKQFLAFIQDGDNANRIAYELQGTLKGLGEIAGGIVGIFKVLGATFRGVYSDLQALDQLGDASQKLFRLDFDEAKKSLEAAKEFRRQAAQASDEIDNILNPKTANLVKTPLDNMFTVPGGRSGFSAVPVAFPQEGWSSASTIDRKGLANALGGITAGSSKGKSGGKSDAQKDAEALAKAINQMTDAQREWQTELDGTGNKVADDYAKRLAQITEQAEDFTAAGIPTEKVKEFTDQMQKLALAIKDKEAAEYLTEFGLQTQEMIANATGASTATIEYTRAINELDKALKSGIISQEEYNKRAAALATVRDAGALQVLAGIQEEQDLLGQSAQYQDTYNKLKYAGVDANDAYGQSIIAANEALWQQKEAVSDQIEAMDALRDAGRGIFDDLRDGVGFWDALKKGVDDFAAALFRIVANNLIEKALGQQGTAGGGSSGGWISTLLSSFFGSGTGGSSTASGMVGPRAIGGPTRAGGFYRVNENGPELVSFGGSDYLMMGNQSGWVSRIQEQAGRVTNRNESHHYHFAAPTDRRTATSVKARRDFEDRRSAQRNN